jgi:hypothetical protein
MASQQSGDYPQVGGLTSMIHQNAREIGMLVGTVERLATATMSAVAGMKAKFGTAEEQAALQGGGGPPGQHRALGPNATAGQTTQNTIEAKFTQAINGVAASWDAGRAGNPPAYIPPGPPQGGTNAQNVGSGIGGGSGGGRAAGSAMGGAAGRAAGAAYGGPVGGAIGGAVGSAMGGAAGSHVGGGGSGGSGEGGGGGAAGGGGGGNSIRTMLSGAFPAGLLGTANKAVDEWHSQSAKNDYYRNIEGGTVANAMGERGREEAYRWNTMGVFSEAEASQAFKGVTRIGYTDRTDARHNGKTRHEVLNYVSQGKQSRGQSVDEGLNQVSAASMSLGVSLKALNKGMEDVSESAGKAGTNTEMARKQMVDLMSLGITKGMGGGSVGIASAVASTTASGGKAYASQVDSSQMYSNQMMYRMASASGKTPMQISNLARNNPQQWAQIQGKMQAQGLSAAGVTPAMMSQIKEMIGDTDIPNNPDEAERIAGEFLNQNPHLDPVAFPNIIKSLTGKDAGGNPLMAAQYLVEYVAGNTDAATATKQQGENGKTDLQGKSKTTGEKNSKVSTSLEKFGDLTTTSLSGFGKRDQALAAQDYVKGARKSGTRNAVIEGLLQDDSLQGDKGDEAHVKVSTKEGLRIVSLQEAIKSYPNEVSSGKVTFVDGESRGKTVQDMAGGVDTSDETTAGAVGEASATAVKGAQTVSDYEKEHGKIPGTTGPAPAAGQAVTISLSDDAKKWFQAQSSGGPVNDAAASGAPPAGSTNGSGPRGVGGGSLFPGAGG